MARPTKEFQAFDRVVRQLLTVPKTEFQRRHAEHLRALCGIVTLRLQTDGRPFVTDLGNSILDCAFGPIANPSALAAIPRSRTR